MFRRNRKKDLLGERIFMYEGRVSPPPDSNIIVGLTTRVACSCGRVIQSTNWKTHTFRKPCMEYHNRLGKLASFNFVSRGVVDTQEN